MKLFTPRGTARRAKAAPRRRVVRYVPTASESLESRRLLAAGPLGINVEISAYASYVNLMQEAGNWLDAPGNTNPIVLNASGDPTSDAVLLFDLRVNESFDGPDPNAVPVSLSGTYHLSFNGQATIQTEFGGYSVPFTIQNQAYDASTNTTTADLVVPTSANGYGFFGISFLDTRATPDSPLDSGFSNGRMIRPGYDANSTQIFTNEFVNALKPFGVLRYHNPDEVDQQPVMDGNTLVTYDASRVDQTGVPWEYQVALANQTHTDMWINIPQGADDSYVTALAGIIKDGGTVDGISYAGLDPSLKVYLEYSNEVWGGIPANATYQQLAVQNTASNQPLSTFAGNLHIYENGDGSTTTDVGTAAGRRYLERTYDISQIFQGVLGADPTHQRIRPVLGWQENNFTFFPPALNWFEHFFGPASATFYGLGNANYWDPGDYSSVDAAINSLIGGEVGYSIPNALGFTTIATAYGLKNVSYEGGPSLHGSQYSPEAQVALAASRDPRMEQIVYQHYVDYFAAGGDLAMYYDGPFGTLTPENQWPIAELAQLYNPAASSRYRGTVDLANASPVAVTAGLAVAPGTPTTLDATTDSLGTSFFRPDTGQQGIWLLNAATSGTYDLKMATGVPGSVMPGQVMLILNDKQVGGIFNVSPSSTVDFGDLPLSAGLNAISIMVVHGTSDPAQGNPFYYQFQPTTFTLTPSTASSPPTLAPVADQSVGAYPASLTLALSGSDPANNPLTYSATAQSLPYALDQSYGFYVDVNGLYQDSRGQQEKYLRGKASATGYDNGGGDFWYYILPGGDLYEFTAAYDSPALTGRFVASLGASAYDDPSLLWDAQAAAVPAALTVAGDQLTVAPASGYSGTFMVTAAVDDGLGGRASQSFKVTVTAANQPPTLAPVADQSVGAYPASLTLALSGSDPANNPLTYSATAQTLPYTLDQSYGFYVDVNGLYQDSRGQQEKYLRGKASATGYDNGGGDFWYYILPGGDLYEFTAAYDSPALTGRFVASLGASAYDDPSLLWNAVPSYALDQSYGFYVDVNGLYQDSRGQQEKYLRGKASATGYDNGGGDFWYYILPGGDLYEFTAAYDSPALTGRFVASLGASAYDDPSLLWDAQAAAVPAALTVAGDQLTVAPASGYSGTFMVTAAVDDGLGGRASQSFKVTVG